jgi:DNA recombination protein RmuC
VHKGLGEMQSLSEGVGDLRRVMTNVKVRGEWGQYLLGNLLEDVLAPEQFAKDFRARERSDQKVEFAVRLPGKGEEGEDAPVWLPIDSKFPKEDYERLTAAAERGDREGVEGHAKALEASVWRCAREIRDKYINPPRTTDWAILFLPTEGLYAEVLRRPGLVSGLQRECRVSVAGPTTLAACLNALQMGFRTLAIQKKSGEVWKRLAEVKRDFGSFGVILEAVQKKLDEASGKLEEATDKSRRISRSLERVEALPAGDGAVVASVAGLVETVAG